jgi:hypothetical protein
MSEKTLKQTARKSAAPPTGPMVDLGYLHRTGMTVRRALVLFLIRYGVDTNTSLAERLAESPSLISHEIKFLREEGFLHPSLRHPGPFPRPEKITGKGTRFCTGMLRTKK